MSLRRIPLLVLCFVACYRYTPVTEVANEKGQAVRVALTDRGSVELAPLIGPTILTLDGTIADAKDASIGLAVTNAIARNGVETSWRGERVDIPRSAINSVQLRSLDKTRSWAVALGGVGAVVAMGAGWHLLGGSFGGKHAPTDGGPR